MFNRKWKQLKQSRFFLGIVSLAIGVSMTVCLYEGHALRQDYSEAMGYYSDYCVRASASAEALEPEGGEGLEPATSLETSFEEIGEFSAYNAEVNQTDSSPTIMASGKKVYDGAIACPARYEFGTKIEIDGMGIYICEDRMNERYRYTNHFDLFMWNYDEAIKFGRKELSFNQI